MSYGWFCTEFWNWIFCILMPSFEIIPVERLRSSRDAYLRENTAHRISTSNIAVRNAQRSSFLAYRRVNDKLKTISVDKLQRNVQGFICQSQKAVIVEGQNIEPKQYFHENYETMHIHFRKFGNLTAF